MINELNSFVPTLSLPLALPAMNSLPYGSQFAQRSNKFLILCLFNAAVIPVYLPPFLSETWPAVMRFSPSVIPLLLSVNEHMLPFTSLSAMLNVPFLNLFSLTLMWTCGTSLRGAMVSMTPAFAHYVFP